MYMNVYCKYMPAYACVSACVYILQKNLKKNFFVYNFFFLGGVGGVC